MISIIISMITAIAMIIATFIVTSIKYQSLSLKRNRNVNIIGILI